jgi:invasion protein IalB
MRGACFAVCLMVPALLAETAVAAGQAPAASPQTLPARAQRGGHTPALAQARPAPQAAAPAPAAAAAAAPETAQALPPQRTETINFDNWILTCREFLEGPKKRACGATVSLQKQDNNQTILVWTVQKNDTGQMLSTVQTPSGVAIAPGIEVKLEKATAHMAFDYCEPNRCSGSLTLDKTFLKELTVAPKVTIVIQSSEGKSVNFEFPIRGFDKALAQM